MSDENLHTAIEDAIWQSLDSEQGMPHSGVDPAFVVPEFLRLLHEAGYDVALSHQMTRWYQCEKCGHMFKTTNWELSGRIMCWQTADGQCATALKPPCKP